MQIELRKDDSLSQRFLRLCQFFEGASMLLQEEEAHLTKKNLFFESHLNKHFSAKKPLTLTYMKQKQSISSSDSNNISTQSTSKPPSSVALEETIMFAIQQAESTLENVRKEELNPTTSKPQRAGIISSYDKPPTNISKPSTRMEQPKATNSKNEPEIKKKPALGKYVLHKLPTMQTTYNTTYTAGSSKMQKQPSVQSGRNSSAASRVTAPTASSNNKTINSTINSQKTQQSQQQIKLNQQPQQQQLLSQQVQQLQSPQISQKEQQIDSRQVLPRISKETTKIPQSSSSQLQPQQSSFKQSELPQNQNNSNKDSQSVALEEFGGGTDLFELLDKDGLDIYYSAKKRAAKAEKEYVEQVKYFREKEHKAKKRFLTKLSEHWAQRKIVETNRIIVYNEKQQNDEELPVDLRVEYEDQQSDSNNEENDGIVAEGQSQQQQLLIDDLRNLSNYANLIKHNLQSENIEMQLLQESFESSATRNTSKLSLRDQFRLWYFLKNLQSNIGLFQKQAQVSMKEYQQLVTQNKQKIKEFLSFSNDTTNIKQQDNKQNSNNNSFTLLLCGLSKNNERPVSANKSTTITINPQKLQSSKDSINNNLNQHDIRNISLPSTVAVRINQLQLKIIFLEFTLVHLFQDLQEALLRNLQAPKISVKTLQSHLGLLRSIISLVNHNGKRFPAFFFTENVEKYFENISQ